MTKRYGFGLVAILVLSLLFVHQVGQSAASSSMEVVPSGDVGIGTSSPTAKLHVYGSGGDTGVIVEEASGSASNRTLLTLQNANGAVNMGYERGDGFATVWENGLANSFPFDAFVITKVGTGRSEFRIDSDGDLTIAGDLVTGGGGTCDPGPCDRTFSPEYQVESIEEHAEYMWKNRHLWGVGPTPEGEPINLSRKTTGILHELEKAHIYIEQLNEEIKQRDEDLAARDARIDDLEARLSRLEERWNGPGDSPHR